MELTDFTEAPILILVGIVAVAFVMLAVVRARTGSFSVSWKDFKAALDMGGGSDPSRTASPDPHASDRDSGRIQGDADVGHIQDVEVGRGGEVRGDIRIGHDVGEVRPSSTDPERGTEPSDPRGSP